MSVRLYYATEPLNYFSRDLFGQFVFFFAVSHSIWSLCLRKGDRAQFLEKKTAAVQFLFQKACTLSEFLHIILEL